MHSKGVDSNVALQKYAHYIVSSSGLGALDKRQLDQFYLTNKIQGISLNNVSDISSITARFDPSSFMKVIQAIYLYSSSPKIDTSIFNTIIAEAIRDHSFRGSAITLSDTIRYLKQGDNRQKIIQQLSQLTPKDVFSYFREKFSVSKNTKYIISGNFDARVYCDLILKYLGHIPIYNERRPESFLESETKQEFNPEHLKIYSGRSERAQVRLQWDLNIVKFLPNKVALEFITASLNMRLRQKLRVEEGAVYSYSVISNIQREWMKKGMLKVEFETFPEKTQRLIRIVEDEIVKLQQELIDVDVFSRIRQSKISSLESSLNNPNFWSEYIMNQIKSESSGNTIYDEFSFVKKLRPEDIRNFAISFIKPEIMSTYILLPQ